MNIIRFQDALQRAVDFVKQHYADLGSQPVLVRDLYGRIRIVLPKPAPTDEKSTQYEELAGLFCQALGNFSSQSVFLYQDELFDPEAIFDSPDKINICKNPHIDLLDRQIIGQDWLREPIASESGIQRVTVFGIKGGVGRSTALAVWAWYLAQHGKRVLVLDFDLESPGLGQTLLPESSVSDFGIVDWLVEEAVGQADESLLSRMVSTSPLCADKGMGEIRVVPAAGAKEIDYIAKLSRAYMELSSEGSLIDFAERLSRLLQALEEIEKPDIVLLDSRAGMHDIAAVTVTRLNAYALLFAMNTPQTWSAYRLLFQHWQRWHPNLHQFRNNLKIVAGMVPETGRADYIARCRQSAYALFSETLYEKNSSNADDVFYFDENANDAPHHPILINWHRAFQEFDPKNSDAEVFDKYVIMGAYGAFLKQVTLGAGLGNLPIF
jgi:hypothetical protein